MVGAGFSKNAERIASITGQFPSWDELAVEIDKSLYTGSDSAEERRLRIASMGSTRLAGEYEVTLTRASLNDLIARTIPDTQYIPGDLHRLLLSLPWSDVFTTNYDTLLERAQSGVFERKYDVVVTAADIVGRMKPRIVKLHGSLPSYRPFIITEEDFRTYPARFAPFVNLVQQSIMENVLCLIGFSGNDPNFLHWIGWVRDNLGDATPPIYLCGLLNLSSSERHYLEQVRRITPVDLSPLFVEYSSEVRHAAALEWFLATLRNGAPPNLLEWPTPTCQAPWRPSRQLPPMIPAPKNLTDLGPRAPLRDQPRLEQLAGQVTRWRQIRQEYPGWVIAPGRNRRTLWNYTEQWLGDVVEGLCSLPVPVDLELLYELNWRLERVHVPLPENVLQAITSVVEKYNPYPGLIDVHEAELLPTLSQYDTLNWSQVGEWWVALVFAVLRAARERLDAEAFDKWSSLFTGVSVLRADWRAQWHHERSLFYLISLNTSALREELYRWSTPNADPFWQVRRAALFAELGDLREAERICADSLLTIRSRITPFLTDYALLSREGWTMRLLQLLEHSKLRQEYQYDTEYRDRWSRLDAYRANPGPEIDSLVSDLARPQPRPESTEGWNINHRTRRKTLTTRFSSSLMYAGTDVAVSELIPAFAFLRMFEEGGIPTKCGIVSVHTDSVCAAADWVFPLYPFLSISAMIRSGKPEEIESRFSVPRTAMLPQQLIDHIAAVAIPALTQEVLNSEGARHLKGSDGDLQKRLMRTLPVLLGQLCFRLSARDKESLFDLGVQLYHDTSVRRNISLAKAMGQLFNQALSAMDASCVVEHFPTLLALPLPGQSGFDVTAAELWPEPIDEIDSLTGYKLDDTFDRSAWSEPISYLIQAARSGAHEVRRRAILRLARLWSMEALSQSERELFGSALWSQIDAGSGLPSGTGILNFGFLALPAPDGAKVHEKLRDWLLSSDFTRTVQHSIDEQGHHTKSFGIGKTNQYVRELYGATASVIGREAPNKVIWKLEEAEQLLNKIVSWWDEEKSELGTSAGPEMLIGMLRDRFSVVVPLMTEVIVPHLVGCKPAICDIVERLNSELEAHGFGTLPLECSLLILRPEKASRLATLIRSELNSTDEAKIDAAIRAIVYWVIYHDRQLTTPPPQDLVDELIYRLRLRRQPGLRAVMMHLKTIIDLKPRLLSAEQAAGICEALKHLVAETALPKETLAEPSAEINAPISFEERPAYRILAAELAFSLSHAPDAYKPGLNVFQLWEEACRNDVLPEVRRAWRDQSAHAGAE